MGRIGLSSPSMAGPELKGTGSVGLVGTATAATYNTATGAGSVTRVNGANQSFVQFAVVPGRAYRIDIESLPLAVFLRDGGPAGTILRTVDNTRVSATVTPSSALLVVTATAAATSNFTVYSLR